MKVSWKWLNELINIQHIPINKIITKLILAGFEVEEIKDKPKIQDKTIDISITANRGDTFSIVGIAREISVLFNLKFSNSFKNPYINMDIESRKIIQNEKNLLDLQSNALLDLKFNTITQLKQHSSPLWLTNYLEACDIKPTDILCDIIEYIKIKWGQDIEIFDLDKINKNNNDNTLVKIEKLKEKEEWMNILDSCDLKLNTNLEVLKYNNKTLSIIGMTSNPSFKCDITTSSIIIVGQICKTKYIKQIKETLKSKTDKLNKNLKYISINDLMNAHNETVKLISCLTNGAVDKSYTINQNNNHNIDKKISVDKQYIINILGPLKYNYQQLSDIKILEILNQLNFQPQYNNNTFTVTIPEHRQLDIKRSIDIIEEIGRVYGFNQFLDQLPVCYQKGQISDTVKYIEKVRNILSNFGLHEVINYSLEDKFIQHSSKIKLHNTLLEDQSQLKDNLIRDLIITKKYNTNKKNSFLEFFEIGRVFRKQKISIHDNQYIETLHIAGIIGNANFSRRSWKEKSQSMSWFQAKGLLEDFLEKLNTHIIWIQSPKHQISIISSYWNAICHPHRVSILCNKYTKEKIGILGELSIKYNNAINSDHRTYIFELNLFNLIKTIHKIEHLSYIYKPYSNYPSVTRDISLKLHKNKSVKAIQEYILNHGNSLIKSVEIFNEYNNQDDSSEHRSIGLRIIYQSNIKTLNDKDIENIDSEINKILHNMPNNNKE
uniref:phenylalanine-tRNA ligase beta subunit n=1 Tax=Anunuuluaehu liula TaxID=3049639 RepID=UPI0030018E6F